MVKDDKLPKRKQPTNTKFLTLTSSQLTEIKPQTNEINEMNKQIASLSANQALECRLVIERVDGSRLQLNLPMDWPRIDSLCSNFLKG